MQGEQPSKPQLSPTELEALIQRIEAGVARRIGSSLPACVDVAEVTDTVHRILSRAGKGGNLEIDQIEAYLFTASFRRVRRSIKKERRREQLRAVAVATSALASVAQADDLVERLAQREAVELVRCRIDRIECETVREALQLRLFGELTFEQIAHQQRVSVPTAHRRFQKGLEILQSMSIASHYAYERSKLHAGC